MREEQQECPEKGDVWPGTRDTVLIIGALWVVAALGYGFIKEGLEEINTSLDRLEATFDRGFDRLDAKLDNMVVILEESNKTLSAPPKD